MQPWLSLALSVLLSMTLDAAEPTFANSRQCVLVVAPQWSATHATLQLLERTKTAEPWRTVRGPLPVTIGRHGLAPATDLPGATGARKREGDGCSPAGVFTIGPAFGFAPVTTRLPFRLVKPDTVAVDDPRSRFYNQIVDASAVRHPDWQSVEQMHAIPAYRMGLVVEYNTGRPAPGAGSCIFLHCNSVPPMATTGCTAMADANVAALLAWLDPAAHPRLVQLPHEVYEKVREAWGLPELK